MEVNVDCKVDCKVDRVEVNSSLIASVGHNGVAGVLEVEFVHGGAVYRYSGVSTAMYQEMMAAESVGKWFSKNVKARPDLYPFVRVG